MRTFGRSLFQRMRPTPYRSRRCQRRLAWHIRPTLAASATRRGAVLAAVMIAMIAASILFGALLKAGATERKLHRIQQHKQQAVTLAESALERAAARLADDAAYRGETWQLSAADLGGNHAGAVVIQVDNLPGSPARRKVSVEASYPATGTQTTRHSLAAVVDTNRGRTP